MYYVSLLVRLWVEIFILLNNNYLTLSASSWGCELKCQILALETGIIRQPPREAVSWNENYTGKGIAKTESASSWGCELKFHEGDTIHRWNVVSLLVRLWVEISCRPRNYFILTSASSWGCELKYIRTLPANRFFYCQPPREAVSWNVRTLIWKHRAKVSLLVRLWVEMVFRCGECKFSTSASSWGCELKYLWFLC